MKEYKYKTTFSNIIVAAFNDESNTFVSKASIEKLKGLELPDSLRLEDNIDLIATIYNAAVINRLNRNDDGISTETALSIKPLFLHKPQNIDHNRSKVVGHIVNAGWSAFGSNEMLDEESIKNSKEPFNLVLGGVVYKTNNKNFTDLLIEASDETSPYYMGISASWELAFDEYHICLGSKNVKDAEIISDPEEIKKYDKYLRANGGTGKTPDGKYVGRLIVGEAPSVLPIGIGFVENPAAEVQGVFVSKKNEDKENIENANKKENTFSQNLKLNVIDINMPNKAKEIIEKMPKEISDASSVTKFIADEIEKLDKEYTDSVEASKKEVQEKEKALTDIKDKYASLSEEYEKLKKEIQEIKAALNSKLEEDSFQQRMNSISEEFEFSEKEMAIVAKKIKGLSDAEFASYYEELSVFSESKKKSVIEASKKQKEEADKKIESIASVLDKEAIDKIKTEKEEADKKLQEALAKIESLEKVPNSTEINLKNELEQAFKSAVKITTK